MTIAGLNVCGKYIVRNQDYVVWKYDGEGPGDIPFWVAWLEIKSVSADKDYVVIDI